MKSVIFNRILEAVSSVTEIPRARILSKCKKADVAEARSILFFYLRRIGFTPPQISDLTGHSRQCISQHIISFADRCKVSGKIMVIMMNEINKMLKIN